MFESLDLTDKEGIIAILVGLAIGAIWVTIGIVLNKLKGRE
jgi:hypothetical protein